MEQFAGQIKEVDEELKSQVKSLQAKAVELFESARLQSAMVFGLNDEPIPGVDALSNASSDIATCASSVSIVLNPLTRSSANKRKHKQSASGDPNQASNNAMLMANSLKESIAVFAQALLAQNQIQVLSTNVSKASCSLPSLDDKISRMESRLTDVQNTMNSQLAEIQQNMEVRLEDVTSLLGRILAAVGTGSNQGGDGAQAGRTQAGEAQAGGAQASRAQAGGNVENNRSN